MRQKLATQEGERKKFRGVFSRLGKKINFKGYSEDTVLLINILDVGTNSLVADHVWFSFTKGFEKITLTEGAIIEFEARVKTYTKGYVNKRYGINKKSHDFKLSHPTKFCLVTA